MMREIIAAAPKTMRGIIFSVLQAGQRVKHENELRRYGFDVETRDFPKKYVLDAYDVIFIVKDHAPVSDQDNAERAAKLSGKPWVRLTKKLSNPLWDNAKEFAKKHGLTPLPDTDSHEATFAVKPFAAHLSEYVAGQVANQTAARDASEWQELAAEYEAKAVAAEKRTAEVEARVKALETELVEVRALKAASTVDSGEIEQLKRNLKQVAQMRDTNTTIIERQDKELQALRDELARKKGGGAPELQAKLDSANTMLSRARKERDDGRQAVAGLQDEIDRLNAEIVRLKLENANFPASKSSAPAGKKLVPANIATTVEKLWSLVGDGVLEADEAIEKILAQLKGE